MEEKKLQKILKKLDRINPENHPKENIDIYHEIAEAYRSIGNYDQAISYFNLELHESEQADLQDDILYCHRFVGECYLYKNQFTLGEKSHLNFLSLAKRYANDERIEQAYTCLSHTYWLWFSYLQDDILYDVECDQLPKDLRRKSLEAAENSLLMIHQLDYQLEIDIKEKVFGRFRDRQEREKDLALRRVRSYINIANALCENYINNIGDNVTLKSFSQYTRHAIELAKKYNLYQELARLHSSLSCFYLALPNYLQYKKEILTTMEHAIHYAELTKTTNDYLSCLYDIAQTLVSFDDYEEAKYYLFKIYRYKNSDHPIKEKAMQDLANVQRLLTGLEDRYESETNLLKKMSLAEKCADTFACLNRLERGKLYYLKQLKHAQELNLDEVEMATIYSSLGSICQDLKEWQLSIDYFRREMSCRIGLGIQADIEQGYSLCEIIKCEYRLKLDLESRMRTFKRVLTIARSTNEIYLKRKTIALIFAMKLRNPRIHFNEDLEEFMSSVQPPITEENCSEILRCVNEYFEEDNSENQENRMHLASKEKNGLKKIQKFISFGDDINHPDGHGWTPLHKSIDRKHLDIVRYLLDQKANINSRTNNGLTPLIIACYHGCLDLIELLLTYGAKIETRTNNGYTAVDYLVDSEKDSAIDDRRKFNRLKELLLIAIKKDEPRYTIQAIMRSDFDDKQIVFNTRSSYVRLRNLPTDRRVRPIQKSKYSITKCEQIDFDEDCWLLDDLESIDPKRKRQRTTMHDQDEIEILDFDHLDLPTPIPKDISLQFITPKSAVRSRQASTTSSITTPIALSFDSNIRIIRCTASSTDRTIDEKKLRIPISSVETVTNLRYQILKRLYDNFHICACFVALYDREDWELGLSESDTIQLALPSDELDIKAIYIEKDPLIMYEKFCREMNSVMYSNIRLVLKLFFDKFQLSFQRLSLKTDQARILLRIFENFMFICSINLSENHLTDEIFEELIKLTLDQLKTLNLSKNEFTSNGIRKLFEEKTLNNLTTLALTDNADVDSSTVDFLRLRFPNLTIYR